MASSHGTQDRSDRLLEVIKAQTEISSLGPDLGAVMALVVDRARQLTAAAGAVIEMAEGEQMVYRAAAGTTAAQLGLRLQRVGSLSGLCVEQGQPLRCDDSELDPRVDLLACRKVGLRSMIVVPLKHHDTVVGVLKVLSPAPAAFDEADLHLLGLMSGLVAATMYHCARYATDELFHRATHDPLTGLANRALFFDRLRLALAQAQRDDGHIGILNLDMDGLKPINDSIGHRAGDAAIKEVAARITQASRQSDTVARLGGDEFGVILPQVDSRQGVIRQSVRVAELIGRPFNFEQHALSLSASVGLAVFPEDGGEPDALLEKADQSMYAIKRTRQSRSGEPKTAS
jgi:diguanylate cyclase (GGDEF)-like protein